VKRTLLTDKTLPDVISRIEKAGMMGLDTESIGPSLPGKKKGEEGFLNVYRSQLAGISLAFDDGCSFYAPVMHTQFESLSRQSVAKLYSALAECQAEVWMHNAKHDIRVLEREGVSIRHPRCSMVLAWLVARPGIGRSGKGKGLESYGLKALALDHLGEEDAKSFKEVIGDGTWADVSGETALAYACPDAEWTLRLAQMFYSELQSLKLERWFLDVEMPYVDTLRRMEDRGMGLNIPKLEEISANGQPRVSDMILTWGEMFPGSYIGSRQQVAAAMFPDHWPMEFYRETDKGSPQVTTNLLEAIRDASSVSELGREAAKMKLEYQALTKNLSTYTDSLIEFARCYPDERVHPSFNQTGTRTGRLSSSGPNWQNLPRRTDFGKLIKSCVVPAPGNRLVSADYSQIELRVFAHFAGKGGYFDAYREGADVHQRTADRINAPRDVGKKIIFTVLYGGGPKRVAEDNGLTMARAKELLEALDREHPEIPKLKDASWRAVKQRGYIKTIAGRIRRLATDGDRRSVMSNQRRAFSTAIQGSAGDIMKVAALELDKQGFPHVAQVHDSACGEVEARDAEEASHLLKRVMESAWDLKVPLVVEGSIGENWLECK